MPYSLGILVWKFYQTFVLVSIEVWLKFEPQIRPTRFEIKFLFITLGLGPTTPYSLGILGWKFYQTFVLMSIECWQKFITARAERKVNFVWNCFIHFLGDYWSAWPEICRVLSLIQARFYLQFQEKTILGEFFQNFCANKGNPLPRLEKFCPTFCNFILGPYCIEKIHTITFICYLHPGKESSR